ncbi:MAG: hypothetical protein IPK37_07685 [Austwickia sp.]|jgi:hypothetical protein|nr:MAG: hypothetical protein IPK37_07685 [Austwickia sp.]
MPRRNPTVGSDADLSRGEEAARQLRREVRTRTRFRVVAAGSAGMGIAVGVGILHSVLRDAPPTIWVVVCLGIAVWLGLAVHARRAAAADLVGLGHPIAATIVRTPTRSCVEVRDATGAVWSWRRRATPRPITEGERCWIFGDSDRQEAPQLVMARPVGAGRYVVWAASDREISRLPDPATDHDTGELPTIYDDEPYS